MRNIKQMVNEWLYSMFASNIQRPNFSLNPQMQAQLKNEGYYSQHGQDKWVLETLFDKNKKGVFVDIGAHDGITFSNTYLLEQRGWTGVVIEPNPIVYEKLSKNRKCITVQGCITSVSGKAIFRVITGYSEMLSGLITEYDARHLERINREIKSRGGDYRDIEVDCYNLVDVLQKHGISHVDYLNIDIEGAEYRVLQSIDFNNIEIGVIGVENNYRDWRIPRFLTSKGYIFNAVVGDEFYVKST